MKVPLICLKSSLKSSKRNSIQSYSKSWRKLTEQSSASLNMTKIAFKSDKITLKMFAAFLSGNKPFKHLKTTVMSSGVVLLRDRLGKAVKLTLQPGHTLKSQITWEGNLFAVCAWKT